MSLCPMKFSCIGKDIKVYGGTDTVVSLSDCDCDEEKCAWWVKINRGNPAEQEQKGPEGGCCITFDQVVSGCH